VLRVTERGGRHRLKREVNGDVSHDQTVTKYPDLLDLIFLYSVLSKERLSPLLVTQLSSVVSSKD
jgi:hypothetical protein